MEVVKGSSLVCGLGLVCVCSQYVCICAFKRDSVLYRSIKYCVIGLSQPRYVMLNLVAKSTREKGEKKTTNVQFICKYERVTQQLHFCLNT